jgi:hypothetical protein
LLELLAVFFFGVAFFLATDFFAAVFFFGAAFFLVAFFAVLPVLFPTAAATGFSGALVPSVLSSSAIVTALSVFG